MDGTVLAVTHRDAGTIEIGGAFTSVGGSIGARIASFLAKLSVVPTSDLTAASGLRAGQMASLTPPAFSGPTVQVSYTWQRREAGGTTCTPIDGTGGPTRTLTAEDVGARLRVEVAGRGPLGQTASTISQRSAVVAPTNVVPPAIVGAPLVGSAVGLEIGTWLGADLRRTLTVLRCHSQCATAATYFLDGGVTGAPDYVVSSADQGVRLRPRVAASRNGSAMTTATSASSAPVRVVTPVSSPSPAPVGAPPSPLGDARARGGAAAEDRCADVRRPTSIADRDAGQVELSLAQLSVDQRIVQAAIRRAAAIERWLASGIQGGDICGARLGPEEFAAGVSFDTSPGRVPQARPRPLRVARAITRPGSLELSARQLRINQRIAHGALLRVNARSARFSSGLTDRDVRAATIDMGRLVGGIAPRSADSSSPPPPPATAAPKGARSGAATIRLSEA